MFSFLKPTMKSIDYSWRRLIFVTMAIALLLVIPVEAGAVSGGTDVNNLSSANDSPGDGVRSSADNWVEDEQRTTAAVQDTPETVLTFFENLSEWRITDGLIYLSDTCDTGQTTAYVRRRAVNGTVVALLESVNSSPQCRTFLHAATDESGIYYYNRNQGRLEAIYSDTPDDPPTTLANIGDWTSIGFGDGISALKLDGSYVYWIEAEYGGEGDPAHVRIRRVSKSGGTPSTRYEYTSLAAAQVSYNGLGVTSSHIWWIDEDGLNRIHSCTLIPCSPGPVVKTLEVPISISAVNGFIQVSGSNVFWWNRKADQERIRRTSCSFFGGTCSTESVHLPASGVTILGLAANGEDAFWTENVQLVGNRLRRKALSNGTVETWAEGISWYPPYLDVDGVYFKTDARTISRLPFDATAISREIGIRAWEVTQGIQRPINDVPLVAGKITYVRLYPELDDGTDVSAVTAELYGSRDGQPLPGSPIYPLNGTIPVDAGLSLADRGDLDSGWLFRLPNSWTRTGDGPIPQENTTISLRGVIDPYGAYADTDDPANNEISADFQFTAKAPTCLILRPVITDAPYEATYGINVGQVLELTEAVLPTPRLITLRKLDPLQKDECVDDPSCSIAYDLDADDTNLLTEMIDLDSEADFPPICEDSNARTLFAGIIHNDATWDSGGVAFMGLDVFLAKVPTYGTDINYRNYRSMTMVHEITHNYNRLHVQCPMPPQDPNDEDNSPANPDPNYPYPTNRLDSDLSLDSADLHYGFDSLNHDPISPSNSRDYMSYCSRRWISDYTWKAISNNTAAPLSTTSFQSVNAEGDFVRVTGTIDAENNLGSLNYAWVVPSEVASDSMKQKFSAGQALNWENRSADANYHLQLIDTDGQVLADKVVELITIADGDENDPKLFELIMTAPTGTVAGLKLVAGDTVLAERNPGTTHPVVSIDNPTGGESIDGEITVGWTASDADGDPLLYNILYSPNNGDEWVPLLVNYGGTGEVNETITLDLSSEAGSDGVNALIRIRTSDGYNTSMATSQPFSVAKRAPFAAITSPTLDQIFTAEQTIPLNGFASDPEDGLITDEQFVWSTGQTGQSAELGGLAPGSHNLQLTVTDSDSQEASSSAISFTVAPLAVPETADSFTLDGRCDDAGYLNAPQLLLSPYDDGSRASARIIHTSSSMWLCLINLQDTDGYAGLLVDADNSGKTSVQSGDFGYFIKKDGTRFVNQGNGSSFEHASAGSLSARIYDNGTVWSAELEISKSAFGDWQKRLALAIGHFEQTGGASTAWPRSAAMLSPQSWGQTNLGLVAALTAVEPASAVLGTGDINLTVSGANFTTDNQIFWNSTVLSTTLVDASTLTAIVPSNLATTAGTYQVSVGVVGVTGLTTAPTPFIVNNPQPNITSLSPSSAKVGGSSMVVTINGTGFVNGASVVWDGEARPTTFVSTTKLTINVETAELTSDYTVPVVVINPEPSAGLSNTVKFAITTEQLFLPLVER